MTPSSKIDRTSTSEEKLPQPGIKKYVSIFIAILVTVAICIGVGHYVGVQGFAFSWTLNFSLMALYTFIASKFHFKLRSSYFTSHPIEKKGEIYKYAGVHIFRKLLIITGWEKMNKKERPVNKNKEVLKNAEYHTRSSEFGHLLIFITVGMVTLLAVNNLREAQWLISTNILLNLYPILLQRYNRPRYRRVLQKLQQK